MDDAMDDPIHPARRRGFDALLEGLENARASRAVSRRYEPSTGLSMWTYSNACVYDDLWDEYSLLARGLVLHEGAERVVATPFPKFFNAGEKHGDVPEGPFEAFEKLDGTLIVLFRWDGAWRATTKGAFDSEQAKWAQARIAEADLSSLEEGTTYLLEAVYPENRIVVAYGDSALVFLAAYRADGREVGFDDLSDEAARVGWRTARRQAFASVADMVARAETLPADEEGFVARWRDGTRLKVKGAEYRRIHALVSRVTPLAIYEMMLADDDLAAVRKVIPEEFWADFDSIVALLETRIAVFRRRLEALADEVRPLSDKEIALAMRTYPEDVRPFLFHHRKGGWAKIREKALKTLRPTGNDLPGYTPSYAMGRVLDQDA